MTRTIHGLSLAAVRLSDVDLGLIHILDEAEIIRANTFRFPALRDRFVAGRIALRLHIGAITGDNPGSLKATYFCPSCSNRSDHGHGIPQYQLPSYTGSLHVSLSRYGNWCLLGASLDENIAGVGLDIENGAAADFKGFQFVAMTANERRQLRKLPPGPRTTFQTRLWVRKEAVLKALGTGMATTPSLLDVSGSTPIGLGRPEQELWNVEDLGPAEVGLPEDFAASVAIRKDCAGNLDQLAPVDDKHARERPRRASSVCG